MSACVFIDALKEFPFGETEHGRAFFWSTVAGSWLLTFVPQSGRRNYSIVDRLWPILPAAFSLMWMYDSYQYKVADGGAASFGSKLATAQLLVLVWSVRMTYNSIRRGDYRYAAEDYRWAYVRASVRRLVGGGRVAYAVAWELFNVLFIAVFQVSLLYLISSPLRLLHERAVDEQWTLQEAGLALLMAALLAAEAAADNQQYELQTLKKTLDEAGGRQCAAKRRAEVEAGFAHMGMWGYSRHPNVFCEQAFWLTLSAFCLAASQADLYEHQTALYYAGPLLLTALMWGSVSLTESISASKYPLYRAYQMRTSRLVPWVPSSSDSVINRAHKYQ
ncbi:hypothetical protein GQ54DRAFT_298229 [Martensiomyces pterosporus]|nr:hypothetical protein GQ54DRAFT_298229 [Martensiomyces pterosporus]